MKKYLIFLLIISFSAAAKLNELQQIDSELKEVIKLNKQLGARDPELLLRLSELYLEKPELFEKLKTVSF